ncbi:uncharacterized protein LOC108475391 [Gossypium arboreum]|uniref:RNase H type-1 domain-containing protein n=1 Tax=Gossypium hirsutum TaxID=3635 RepID=A0ABM2YHP7_GOSHI|nr:uncharacterized protein LOC108475391 [Gossypium arboreum]XP_040930076.1 uncharacterized protein LOC121203702 [Gossypium hirsutum]
MAHINRKCNREWTLNCSHIGKEANAVADCLVHHANNRESVFMLLPSPPAQVQDVLDREVCAILGREMIFGVLRHWSSFAQCISYSLRKQALHGDMTRYVCCAGYICCSLCLEVACCFSSSVLSTRYLLQDEYDIKTTKCDNCIIAFMVILSQLACLCHLVASLTGNEELEELAELLTCLSELVCCVVCACMQTQHKIEMDHRHGTIVEGEPARMIPPVQEMSWSDQPEPPSPNQV